MQAPLHADVNADGRQATADHAQSVVTQALGHHGDRNTRMQTQLSDAA